MQKLYDTPGVHLHHRQTAVVHSEDLASLAPQSRLRGLTFPVCSVQNCLRHYKIRSDTNFILIVIARVLKYFQTIQRKVLRQ